VTRQRFKQLDYQRIAAETVVDCFESQPKSTGLTYTVDPGTDDAIQRKLFGGLGTRNAPLALADADLLANIRKVQRRGGVPQSDALATSLAAPVNLDVEMETGTGKTYVYIDTMYRLHERYGWSKFIVVVPSIAIREGVKASFDATEAHFAERYGHKVRRFVYDSSRPEPIAAFADDRGLHCMIVNTQAFTSSGQAQRLMFVERDSFQSRKPIDLIAANRPILILDEPQRMEGRKTQEAMQAFRAPFALRYSATHRTSHNLVHRLDALDAFEHKLVKRIEVRGVVTKGLGGTSGYLYLSDFDVRVGKNPRAKVLMEVKNLAGDIKRKPLWLEAGDDVLEKSGGLDQYRDHVVEGMDVTAGELSFTSRDPIRLGVVEGTEDQSAVRAVQIREAIDAHLKRERLLHRQGIKCLTLFFIDEVAKYRRYDDRGEKVAGEYAELFEALYADAVAREKEDTLDAHDEAWLAYLDRDAPSAVHEGYFSIDKKGRMVDSKVAKRGETQGETDDQSAYDLILRDKERLLSLAEPVRFVFSHSALREGWDNPNVFTICTLRESASDTNRRQEVGRGLRICVDRDGVRMDQDQCAVHEVNVLTVIAPESYADFTRALQKDLIEAIRNRPHQANAETFEKMSLVGANGEVETVSAALAGDIEDWLVRNRFVDRERHILPAFAEAMEARKSGELPGTDPESDTDLLSRADEIVALVRGIFDPSQLPKFTDGRRTVTPKYRPENLGKAAFQTLWQQINRQAVYFTRFDTDTLIRQAVMRLDNDLTVPEQRIEVQRGSQRKTADVESWRSGDGFREEPTPYVGAAPKVAVGSHVRYDVVGRIASRAQLTRRTVGEILKKVNVKTFALFGRNPEAFMARSADLVRREKVRLAIEHIRYEPTAERYDTSIFTSDQPSVDAARTLPSERSIFDHVVYDSGVERAFAQDLETKDRVIVYAKLPRRFSIPTPGGTYNPDWAVALRNGETGEREIYFVAETKGSAMAEDLKEAESQRIACAKIFFGGENGDASWREENVIYRQIDSYDAMIDAIVG